MSDQVMDGPDGAPWGEGNISDFIKARRPFKFEIVSSIWVGMRNWPLATLPHTGVCFLVVPLFSNQ